ncbi:DNA (cytosine-5)-methyltransferase DRM2-like, partial [Selaginella moellendorffii]|uniref:DNA (cytosine-5)-methyltransferase DRM2-like n=1 Tax=Selaginella moellendorffii TaxID=88036 RepID=UPI000D1CBCF2
HGREKETRRRYLLRQLRRLGGQLRWLPAGAAKPRRWDGLWHTGAATQIKNAAIFQSPSTVLLLRERSGHASRELGGLDGIEPELVNSKWFCAASRPRGYVHNLPVKGRRALHPGPMTIQELVPGMENVRPPWDKRVKLNCITTSSDRAARVQASAEAFYNDDDVDPQVFLDMKRANLVWRGRGILAPLEVQELEVVQGFDVGHTSSGQSPAERIKALGNAMQVHTVAWHLSVLGELFPSGIRVLSLFSGIGGIEVALEKLGIPIKFLVSVETSADCHRVLRSWWHRTRQRGTHIVLGDVTELSRERIEELAARAGGGFDLVAGGSPCNNFSGNNRTSRTGITGDKSRLFFDYVRILTTVRSIMAKSAS